MREKFKLITEDGEEKVIEFSVVKDEHAEKPYGISACICGNADEETAVAEQRFFTYAEAIAAIDMLCRHQVTPCTLCDVI